MVPKSRDLMTREELYREPPEEQTTERLSIDLENQLGGELSILERMDGFAHRAETSLPNYLAPLWTAVIVTNWLLLGLGILPPSGGLLVVNLILNLAGFLIIRELDQLDLHTPFLRRTSRAVYLLTFLQTILNLMFLNDFLNIGSF